MLSGLFLSKEMLRFALMVMMVHSGTPAAGRSYELKRTQAFAGDQEVMPQDRFPYLASVRKVDQHVCTGALVHNRWVIVAAHCINNLYPKEVSVVLGSSNVVENTVVRTIIDVRFPPTYTGSKTDGSNIALLKLEDSSLVSPIAIAEAEYGHHGAGIRIGLGRGTVRDLSAPFELQENGVVPKVNCEDAWNLKMFPSMSCVSARINETCRGENTSGILVVASSSEGNAMKGQPSLDALIGLLSIREDPCEIGTKPSIYTTIAPFQHWVESLFAKPDDTAAPSIIKNSSTASQPSGASVSLATPTGPPIVSLSLQWVSAPEEENEPSLESYEYDLDALSPALEASDEGATLDSLND